MSEPSQIPDEIETLLRADGEGPALRIDPAAARLLVEQALDGTLAGERSKPLRIGRWSWMLAAAFVLVGSAAAMYAAQQAQTETAAPRPAEPSATASARVIEPPQPAAPTRGVAQPAPQPRSDEPSAPQAAAVQSNGGAQDLLRRANRLRGEGQYRAAERTYLRVVTQSPAGAPAYAARVAAAGLRNERLADPEGALRLYQEAERAHPRGALAPEIHEGMAQAYRKLNAPADERRALSALLDDQPQGPAAERARKRLEALNAER